MNKTAKVIKEATEFVNRISQDLTTWSREIKRLRCKKDKKSKQIVGEYAAFINFYNGKLAAYIWIIQELNGGRIRIYNKETAVAIRHFIESHNNHYMNKTIPKAKLKFGL